MRGVVHIVMLGIVLASSPASHAGPSLSDAEAKRLIEAGIQYNHLTLVEGRIRLRSALDPNQEADPKNGNYHWVLMNSIQQWGKGGLVTIQELPQDGLDLLSKPFQVTLTSKASAAVHKRDEWGRPMLNMGERSISRIVRNTEWKHQRAGSDDFRLVLGIYDYRPTSIGADYAKAIGQTLNPKYKFRAVLKYNPFSERFSFKIGDWDAGFIDKDEWFTKRVPD